MMSLLSGVPTPHCLLARSIIDSIGSVSRVYRIAEHWSFTTVLDRNTMILHGRRLEYFAVAWNTMEGLVAVVAGIIAGSISLVGFGINSFIEVTSGSAILWR